MYQKADTILSYAKSESAVERLVAIANEERNKGETPWDFYDVKHALLIALDGLDKSEKGKVLRTKLNDARKRARVDVARWIDTDEDHKRAERAFDGGAQ